MLSKTTRNNLIRLLRTELLVNATHAAAIADDQSVVIKGPIHDAVLAVDRFLEDGSGSFEIAVNGNDVGGGRLSTRDLERWAVSPSGVATIARNEADAAAYEASIHKAVVVSLLPSERFPGTAEIVLDDGKTLPLIPVEGESAEDLISTFDELTPGKAVRIMILPARDIIDAFARTLPDDQPCVDWIITARAA